MRPDRDSMPTAAPPDVPDITPELIDAYIRRGREMQAEELRRLLRGLGLRLRALVRAARRRPSPAAAVLAEVAGDLGPRLTSIRSSAELLRDHPDIDPDARSRAVETVLAEEARIERVVAGMLEAAHAPDRRRGQLCPG